MSDTNTEPATVSAEEFNKVQERARKMEALATDREKQLEKYKGLDLDALKAKAEEADILRKQAAVGDEKKIDELIQIKEKEIENRFKNKLSELEDINGKSARELKTLRVTNVAMQSAAEVFNSDALPLIQREIENSCDWDNGSIVVRDAEGKARYSKKDPTKALGVSEFLEELADKFPSCAKATQASGVRPNGQQVKSSNGGRAYTYAELRAMPDGGKAAMAKMTPEQIKNLF